MSALTQLSLKNIFTRHTVLVSFSILGAGFLSSCMPATPKPKPINRVQQAPMDLYTPKMLLDKRRLKVSSMAAPDNWGAWSNNNFQEVREYQLFLDRYRVGELVPIWQQLASAKSHERCGYEPYQVPPRWLWERRIKVLRLVRLLVEKDILSDFSITSTYRDAELNKCASGSAGSKHVLNAAVDIRLEGGESVTIRQKESLCRYWNEKGKDVSLGLGLYTNGQIHLDREAWRTWGPSYSRDTSPCVGSAFISYGN